MRNKNKISDNLTCTSLEEEADILDQLKSCQIYFERVANNISLIENISQFYDNFRLLIGILQKLSSGLECCTREIIRDISVSLIYIIASCSLPLDGQMMCSTAFCSALHAVSSMHEMENLYLSYLNTEGDIFFGFGLNLQIFIQNVEVLKVCLCYGILKSNEAASVLYDMSLEDSPLIYAMLNILENGCMKYSRLTSVAFKVLVLWVKKVCSELEFNMTSDILRRIFSVINSNWESPISGVKEQNTKIFELFLDVSSRNRIDLHDHDTLQSVTSLMHHTMEEQPWKMKSKYYMLSVLLPRYGVRKAFSDFPDLAPGLVSSLSQSHLVSAGSDVYKCCLNNMNSDEWIIVFMTLITEILTDRDVISIKKQNVFNYWLPSTLKRFPLLLNLLLDQLVDILQSSGLENIIFSVISLLKLGQKSGLFFNTWDENFSISSFKFLDLLNVMNSATQNSSETVRAEAFAVVCISSKTCIIPSLKEFELLKTFLLENANIDSASLRQAILNSFTLFLTRICDSSLRELKVEERTQKPKQRAKDKKYVFLNSEESKDIDGTQISQNIQFLNWLHNFLISNLEPGTNYQRKILSLQLYMLVLSYFSEPAQRTKGSCVLKRKGVALEAEAVMKYALQLGKWHFNSERSHKTLLSCVVDPTADIRETAALILMTYFSFNESNTEENKLLLDYALRLCNSPVFYERESGALLMKVLCKWTYKMPPKKSDELVFSMVNNKYNKSLTRNRSRSSNLMLYNQQKLLAGLYNKPNRSVYSKVEIKKKVHCILLKDVCGVEVSDKNMAVVSRDGLVDKSTTSGIDKSQPDSSISRRNHFPLEVLGKVRRSSASEVTSHQSSDLTQNILEGQVEQDSWNRQTAKEEEEADYQISARLFMLTGRPRFSGNPYKNKQVEVALSLNLHKFEGLPVKHGTKDEKHNNPSMNNESRDFKNLSVWNAHSSASSLPGYQTPKFQQPHCFKSSVINDTDFSLLHAGSGGRQHDIRIVSHQESLEVGVPQFRFECHSISKGFYTYKEQNVKPDDWVLFPYEHWGLSESPEGKNVQKFETNSGTCRYEDPSKNSQAVLSSENVIQTYNGSAPLSVFFLTQADAQLTSLKGDIFQAASSGSPLHGTITALIHLATQSDGPECGCMSVEEVNRTVTLLEQTVSFFLDFLAAKSASTAGVAPSFAEMDEAIQSSIQESLSDLASVDEEGMQLSPAHQLVFSCIWLNLKACCTLASGLVCSANCSIATVKRCGRLITQVLTRCRHKGAIESAGVALSTFVKTVTSQTADCNPTCDKDVQWMLGQILAEFLGSVACGGLKASVTRRSAGLSILIHRIVASEMQTGKPLLHMCVSQLLEIARAPLGSRISSEPESVLVDLPQAQALHFLRILVQDSSLRQDMVQYMSSVTIICFSNFSSSVWTVRNAALQLSGALIPKLVGQKKIQDEELTLGSGVSVEEFFSHFPELTDFMLVSLQQAANCCPSQALKQHADLIPMLSLLAKVTVGIEIFISVPLVEMIAQYRVCFLQLISSPIYHVRKLAAKAYERFVPFSSTCQTIVAIADKLQVHKDCDGTHSSYFVVGENVLNGILLTLKYLLEKLNHDSQNTSEFESKMREVITKLKDALKNYMNLDSCTFFNRFLLLELIEDKINTVGTAYISANEAYERMLDVHKTLQNDNIKNSLKPGLSLWAAKVIEVVVRKCCPYYLVSTWYNSYMLFSQCPDIVTSSFMSLKWRLLHDEKISVATKASLFIAILKVCLEVAKDCHALFPLLDVMLVLIQDTKVHVVITFEELHKIYMWSLSDSRNKPEYSKIALPVVAGLLSQYFAHGNCIGLSTETLEFVLKFALCIKDRSDVMKFEEDFRFSAARAMNLLVPSLREIFAQSSREFSTEEVCKEIIEILLDVVLTLLQDEDHVVRKEAAKFIPAYSTEMNKKSTSLKMNPYSSLMKLVEPNILLTLLTVPQAMDFLWKKLLYTYDLHSIEIKHYHYYHENCSINSPFDHGKNNIYSEETKMIDLFGKSLLEIIKVANRRERDGLTKLIKSRYVKFKDDIGTVLSLLKRIESCGIVYASSENESCYIVAKKLLYQSEVMAALKIMGNCEMEIMVELQKFLKFFTN